ncbi:DUF4192 domain-containing protein [Frigoribacterium sp. CG_9.8]|uniref:DUF4192 domain-containing protein n=1 Tax=Frigoribacterium sp. CG_9.8 TaxID=2787733 RepID=UPI0018CBEB25|nr:DUF4192 domain-containing protein [Frigoribacterium sp. CG_9.8]MBG6109109.1 hypothetical protein [Frigoribacterium sp. CG_9.8]
MTVILKANGPADLLAMAPPMVGFLPRNGVVLVAFRGKRTCGAMRFDLPPCDDPVVHKRVVTTIVGMFCKLPEVDAAVVIVYTDDEFGISNAVPQAAFAELIGRRLTLSGFELRESICQAADGWASYFDPDVPAGGHPLAWIGESTVARTIDSQRGMFPPQASMIDRVPRAEKSQRSRLAKRLEAYDKVRASIVRGDGPMPPSVFDAVEDLPHFAERALAWDAAELEVNGALLAFVLQGPPIRDLIMLQWSFGIEVGDRLWERDRLDGCADADLEDLADLGDLMMGIGPRPDPHRIEGGIALLLELTSRAEDVRRPPLLCMLAWLNWALGHGSQAGLHLEEALAIAPGYSMAQLLRSMTGTGILPEWAFEGPSALL